MVATTAAMAHIDDGGTTPVIAKHDFEDGDEGPGLSYRDGPGIKRGLDFARTA